MTLNSWKIAHTLDEDREPNQSEVSALVAAIGNGADLRIGTSFPHNEHIEPGSLDGTVIDEVAAFQTTYLLDGKWIAGIMSLRQPAGLPDGFLLTAKPSMSFFLYNQNGHQGIARPFIDGSMDEGMYEKPPENMPKYEMFNQSDARTRAPSSNFMYHFGQFRFFVRDDWREVLAHDSNGEVVSGSLRELSEAFRQGSEIKVGVSGLWAEGNETPPHEIFMRTHSQYLYPDQFLMAQSDPFIRVRPSIPLKYESNGWDFGWLSVRTDGAVTYRRVDPYTLTFSQHKMKLPIRWFVR